MEIYVMAFRRWMIFWGCMDLIYMGIYAAQNLAHRKIPIWGDILNAVATSHSFGTSFPLVITILGNIFYLTTLISGVLLISGNRWGRYLSYVQVLPRLFFVIPSFFPLIYIFRWNGVFWVTEFILVISEAFKIYSIIPRRQRAKS
jgi:hypothetical protein